MIPLRHKAGMTILFLLTIAPLHASGTGSAGITLFRISGARASALGEAFTAMNNDITALEFNPGSLATLESGQISLQHQNGFIDDSFSKALVGWKMLGGSVG